MERRATGDVRQGVTAFQHGNYARLNIHQFAGQPSIVFILETCSAKRIMLVGVKSSRNQQDFGLKTF
jgi:hypothetical protein